MIFNQYFKALLQKLIFFKEKDLIEKENVIIPFKHRKIFKYKPAEKIKIKSVK